MELQHVNVKLLVSKNGAEPKLEPVVPVFHSWIQEQVFEGQLVDVADYRHVPSGPGVVLIGLDGDFSIDNNDNRLGVRYNRKAALDGGNQERLRQATVAALRACQRLETEPNLHLRFNGQEMEIFINDRMLAPNDEKTREAAKAELQQFADKLFGPGKYSLSFNNDPRRLLTAYLKAAQPFAVTDLLINLS